MLPACQPAAKQNSATFSHTGLQYPLNTFSLFNLLAKVLQNINRGHVFNDAITGWKKTESWETKQALFKGPIFRRLPREEHL